MNGGPRFRVGLIQMRSGRAPAANLDAAAKLISEAKTGGADYVQTPEMTNILEVSRERLFAAIVPEEQDVSPEPVDESREAAEEPEEPEEPLEDESPEAEPEPTAARAAE